MHFNANINEILNTAAEDLITLIHKESSRYSEQVIIKI